MRKLLFILAAMLLGSIGLHAAESFIADNVAYFITSEPDYDEPGTVKAVRVVNKDECAGSFYIPNGVYNPQNGISYQVTEIGQRVFQNCTKMSQLSIGNSVIIIGAEAFKSNYGLTAVSIGYNVERIEDGAFQDCTGLTSISIPSSVTWLGSSVFSGCNKLNTVTIGSSMRTINSFAFENCSSLKTIYCYALTPPELGQDVFKNVPQDVSIYVFDIEEYKKKWPSYSANFKQIIIERYDIRYEAIARDKVRVIAKDGGYTQSDINIPSETYFSNADESLAFTVTEIGQRAFQNCTNLTSITIPNSVTTIGQAAFSRCSGLTSITIPNSVTQIGAWAFEFCNNLQNIDLPSSIRSIDVGTFQWAGLTSITIPASVERIEDFAFWACPLEYVACMSETPPALGNEATFPDAKKALVYVPNINAIAAYQNSDWNKYFTNFVTNTITYKSDVQLTGNQFNVGATTFGPAITSHTFSNGMGTIICNGAITQIGKDAFSNCHSLTSIDIPNSVRTIDLNAFSNCTSLISVTVAWTDAQSIIPINSGVFEGIAKGAGPQGATLYVPVGTADFYKQANGWKDFGSIAISIPRNTITYTATEKLSRSELNVGATTFGPAITSHIFSNGTGTIICNGAITTIGQTAFARCSGLTSIYIPASVTQIGKWAFEYCNNLQNIDLPSSIKSIDVGAFQGAGLTSITIPNSVERIEGWAFQQCPNLKEVTFRTPSKLTFIGEGTFNGNGLTSVSIPASVKEIKDGAFKNCTNLEDLQFADRADAIKIGAYAFQNMALKEAIIPDWMKEIPEGLFYNNQKLETIYLPELVNNIASRSFENCPNLKYIISMAETPPALADGAFKGHDKDDKVIVYVPSNDAIVAYQNSDWSKYFTTFVTNINYRITSSSTVEVISAIPFGGEVTIPSATVLSGNYYQVTGIADGAFYEEDSLVSILLPPTIKYIGANAFNGCTKLKQTNSRFLGGLQTIRERAFYGCSALDSIVIPEGVQTIGKSAFMGCSNLTSISLPTGLKNIPDECFNQCPLGQEIIVPEGVETIGQTAFNGTLETRLRTKSITLPSTLKEINLGAFYYRDGLKEIICHALTPPTLTAQAFASKQFQAQQITVYVPDRDVIAAYKRSSWGDNILYNFKFSDLMAEENKQYLYNVAGNNDEAKKIASAYCDSIDQAATSQEVQYYTNRALEKIDKITLAAYKQRLIDSLVALAGENIEAKQIAEQYAPQIKNAYFRQDAERLFLEAEKKINAIFELIALKENYITQLKNMAYDDPDLQKVAADYGALIQLAETKEQADALFYKAQQRIEINRQIKNDWTGQPSQRDPLKCSTTRGYIDNH